VYSVHPSRQAVKESRTGFLRPMALLDSATVLRTGDTEIVIEEASEAMKAEVRSISRTRLGQSSYIRDRLIYGIVLYTGAGSMKHIHIRSTPSCTP
jgi:hypothetical protein